MKDYMKKYFLKKLENLENLSNDFEKDRTFFEGNSLKESTRIALFIKKETDSMSKIYDLLYKQKQKG